MSTIIDLREKALPPDCYVYKHSTTCGLSARAGNEVKAMATDLPVYWINVREQRDLSNWVEQTYGVTHESPQLILLRAGKPERVWNHSEIKRDTAVVSGQ